MKTPAGALLSGLRIDRGGDRTIAVQLCTGLRELILSGALAPGERLPASRTLCAELGVSRTSVVDALERLASEGLLEARVGAGTFVSPALDQLPARGARGRPRSGSRPLPAPRLARTVTGALAGGEGFVDRSPLPGRGEAFVTGLPALDRFPMAHWARLSAKHWRSGRDAVAGYGPASGLPELRRAIAAHLRASRGIACEPGQVFVTAGAQQAFSLIATVLLDPGDAVWFENPGAIGARNAFLAEGARLVPVAVDADGLDVADGLARAPRFRLAFATPSHQQPLGHVMSLARRVALLNAAGACEAFVVEDDYDGDFHFGPRPPPTLKSVDTGDRVIYVGTFSKSLFPALRLGFLLAPERLVDTFERVCESACSGAPTSVQAVAASFMDEGLFATHVRQMRRLYRARHDALLAGAAALPAWIRVAPAAGGFHTVGRLAADGDGGRDEGRLVAEGRARGLALAPLGRYCLAPVAARGVVLGFGACDEAAIGRGLEVLASLDGRRARSRLA